MSPRTYLLALGAFTVGTSGYIVSGILPEVSRELGVSIATAGQLGTVFAIALAIAAPLLAAFTGRWERRRLLVVALLVSALGNALAAVAPTYELLLVTRVIAALGAAVYTPTATGFATVLNPPERRGRAVAMVFGGLTLALVIGVPSGNLLSGPLGYHGVFALVAAVSVLGAVAVRLGVPAVAAPAAVGLRARLAVAADRRVLLLLGVTVLGVLAAMAPFTYIAPLLSASSGAHGATISFLLVGYGIGATVGNTLGGRATDRFGSPLPLFTALGASVLLLATLPFTVVSVPAAAVVMFVWGMFTWSFNPPMQHHLIGLAGANSGLLLSLNASAIYLGVGLSGLSGGFVISHVGIEALAPVAAVAGLVAVAVLVAALRPVREVAAEDGREDRQVPELARG
ncbi:MFS transporter [Actinophytocola oryzae]|uniref:Putative MFS family arabinose efflux permease n=1 Tax=Actinophytocola oryzae TaxID=502181 RepID=A0A4V3FU23_9PSEU|nr:MFS transporter [Actinophytocola oryzae]TDV53581.1 putative MFS family arabinose efflux permease [Actinophytocola oryzae]